MGGSGNWLKSFAAHKKSIPGDQDKVGGGKKNTKWKLWRSSSSSDIGLPVKRGQVAASEPSDRTTSAVDDVYSAAMATLIRAPPKNFLIVRKEWAAIRIQTAFRALLARRALRALKALVRLQAIVRGRLVRKQAAMTLKCMQALVRVQAQIKARNVKVSLQGKSLQRKPENEPDPVKQSEELRATRNLNLWKKGSFSGPIDPNKLDKSSYALSWPDGWGAFELWEASRRMEEADLDFSLDSVTSSSSSTDHKKGKASSKAEPKASDSFDYDDTIRVAQNSTKKRVAATRPHKSSKGYINESLSSSTSSSSVATEGADESASSAGVGCSKPLYMSPRGSRRRAKQRGVSKNQQREVLYSPAKLDRYDWTRCH